MFSSVKHTYDDVDVIEINNTYVYFSEIDIITLTFIVLFSDSAMTPDLIPSLPDLTPAPDWAGSGAGPDQAWLRPSLRPGLAPA